MADQVIFGLQYFTGEVGILPPPFDLHAGDMVKFKATGDKGIVIRKYKKHTQVEIGSILGANHEIDMFYYEIMWLGKSVRSAGAHMLHQLEKIDSLEDDA